MPEAVFDLGRLEQALSATPFAGQVEHLSLTGSTNLLAMQAGEAGREIGVWIADEQTAGRGRGGHTWHSAPGDGLYLTALVRPRIVLDAARWLPMRTGLAVRASVQEVSGIVLDLRWPNDLFLNERKCGGILVESVSTPASAGDGSGPVLRFAAIGVGLNLGHREFPPELAPLATSLWRESGRLVARDEVAAALLRHFAAELAELERESAGEEVCRRFTAASSWAQGKRVRVGGDSEARGGYTAVTRGLDTQGFLRVQDDEGQIQIVVSGNVRAARE